MTPEQLQDQLHLSGIGTRRRGVEVQLEVCRFCGNTRWNLELNALSGLYHCWACRTGGRVDALLRDLTGREFHLPVRPQARGGPSSTPTPTTEFKSRPAYEVELARRYLERRGIGEEVARAYGLAVCLEAGHLLHGRITIPVPDFWTGQVLGHVGRAYTRKQPKYLSTLPRQTVTGYRVRDPHAPCVVVEGYFDAIAVHRAGFHVGVLTGTGAGDVELFAARVAPSTPIVVMLDGSAQDEARQLLARITTFRPAFQAQLPPGHDPAEFAPPVLRTLVESCLKR